MITEIKKGVYWVGVVDWQLRHFHGHELSTPRGSAYSAFLVIDDKKVIIDSVWSPFTQEYLDNIRSVIDPAEIDIVVSNHSEPDHSGALPALMELCPNATVIVSRQGATSLPGHYHKNWNLKPVKTGDRISIGRRELLFIEATMLHWPDSMFTFVTGDNILFPNDAFGQHYATAWRWNDQVDQGELFYEAQRYYANIITPYSTHVTKKINEILAMNLPIEMICPSHGVFWRDNPMQIVHKYLEYAAQKGERRAVVLYDTMWNATRHMAEAIGEGLASAGVDYKIFHLAVSDRNEVLTEIFKSRGVILGSPTLNHGVLPSVAPIMADIKGLHFLNKVGAAFGSYGWANESVKAIEELFTQCGIPLAAPGVAAKWQPTEEYLAKCRELGKAVAEKI